MYERRKVEEGSLVVEKKSIEPKKILNTHLCKIRSTPFLFRVSLINYFRHAQPFLLYVYNKEVIRSDFS